MARLEGDGVGALDVLVEVLLDEAQGAVLDLLHGDGDAVLAGDDGGDVVGLLDGRDAQVLAADHVVDVAGALGGERAEEERVVLGLGEQVVDLGLDDGHLSGNLRLSRTCQSHAQARRTPARGRR